MQQLERSAARASERPRKLDLLKKTAEILQRRLDDAAAALDVHRRILQLEPGALAALEVAIERHRAAGEWHELRDRLQQWTERA